MKKIISIILLTLLSFSLFAQEEEQSKPTSDYLPSAGNFGIGIDATPILDYLGNMFNGTTNNTLNFGATHLFFKYFIADNASIRLKLDLYYNKEFLKAYSRDDAAYMIDPLSKAQVEDLRIYTDKSNFFSIGYQQYVGENRLRGFFGADLTYGFQQQRDEYTYGNLMNANNPTPTTNLGGGEFNPVERNILRKYPTIHVLGFGLFTGGEYYIMPRLSIGLELGLLFRMQTESQGYRIYETMLNNTRLEMNQALIPNQKGFYFGDQTPYSYGNFFFVFHF